MEQNYYEILGVKKDADVEEINRAFKKMSLKYHPDKNPETTELFKSINIAHKTLSDIKLRSQYNDEYVDDADMTVDSLFRLYGRDPLSKTYRNMYESFLGSKFFQKKPRVFDSIVEVIRFIPVLKSDPYIDRINRALSLNSIWTTKITYNPIKWATKPIIVISEDDLTTNKTLYQNIIVPPLLSDKKKRNYSHMYLVKYEYGITNIFDITDDNKLPFPVNPTRTFTRQLIPMYQIQPLPIAIPDENRPKCSACKTEFTFFNRRHHCRMCGDIQCSDCQTSSSIPHLGYILKTKICRSCFSQLPLMEFDLWVQNIPSSHRSSYLSHMAGLFSSSHYNPSWIRLGDSYLDKDINLAFRCYYYGHINKSKQKKVFDHLAHYSTQQVVFDNIKIFAFNDEQLFIKWVDNPNTISLALSCLDHFKISVQNQLTLAIKKNDYARIAVLFQIRKNEKIVLSDNIDYVILNIRHYPNNYFNSNNLVASFDKWLRSKPFKIIYQIFYEMIQNKITFNSGWPDSYKYAYWLITSTSASEWIDRMSLNKNDMLHIAKLLKLSSVASSYTRSNEKMILAYKLDELSGIVVDWKQIALKLLSSNPSLAFSCYPFELDDFDILCENKIHFEQVISHFYHHATDDETIKTLIIKTFEQSKKLDIIYAGIKHFGIKSLVVKQFHRIIVQNEQSVKIVKSALEYYHDETVYKKLFGEKHTTLFNDLINIFYTYSLSKMKEISIPEDCVKVAKQIVSKCCTESTVLSEILKFKIVCDNYRKSLFYLHSALLLSPDSETIQAIYDLEPECKTEFYVPRQIKVRMGVFQDKLRQNSLIKILRRVESDIDKMTNPLDKAMQYIDLSCAVDSGDLKVNCYLLACTYLLQLENTASKKLISKLLTESFAITYLCLEIFSQKHFYGIILDFMNVLDQFHMIDSDLKEILQNVVNEFKEVNQIVMFNTELTTCLDFLFLRLVNVEYLTYKLIRRAPQSILYQYHLFNGLYTGWITEGADFETERLICMKNLNKRPLSTTEDIMNWPILERNNGWMTGRLAFGPNIRTFGDTDGFILNKKTGELTFLLHGTGLFTTDDMFEIMGNGIDGGFVTLEQPDPTYKHHPYQKMIYGPRSAGGTNFLGTMLHADYILKEFSTGIEVNSYSPFEFREFDHQIPYLNLTDSDNIGRAHRFWIEADDLKYNLIETDDTITVLFDGVKLGVKQHRLKYDSDGKLVDDDEDDAEYKKSPEAVFAETFSTNYDRISISYPIFARLKPLLKLSISVRLIQGLHDYLIRKTGPECDPILDDLKKQCKKYPMASNSNVEDILDDMCRSQGLHDKSRISNLADMRNQIRRQLRESDDNMTDQVANLLSGIFDIDITSQTVHSWLVWGDSSLRNAICFRKQQKIDSLNSGLRCVKLKSEKMTDSRDLDTECLVPAVFVTDNHRRVYGGVNMGVNLQQSNNVQYKTYTENGKIWQVSTSSIGTYETYRAIHPHSSAQGFYRMSNNPIEHITDHSSIQARQNGTACVNVHYTNGSIVRYTQQPNGLYMS